MKTILELRHDDCRFVMRTRWHGMATFCARKTVKHSYCARHLIMCYPAESTYVKRPYKRMRKGGP